MEPQKLGIFFAATALVVIAIVLSSIAYTQVNNNINQTITEQQIHLLKNLEDANVSVTADGCLRSNCFNDEFVQSFLEHIIELRENNFGRFYKWSKWYNNEFF